MQDPIMQFFKTFYDLLHFRVKYLPEHPILAHPPLYAPLQCDGPNVTSCIATDKITVLYVLIFVFSVATRKTKDSGQRSNRLPEFGLSLICSCMQI
jgi:hypothetical protein